MRSGSYFMSSSVSSPSFVFFKERESSMPTMTTSVELSIEVMTSAVKPGGVSMTTQSKWLRRIEYTSRRSSAPTALAWSARRAEDDDEARGVRNARTLVDSLLAGEQLVDLEAHLLAAGRKHHDVVCAGLERAPEEAVRRPVPEHHDREVGVLLVHGVEEQQGAVRVAGAGDEEHVRRAVAQPAEGLLGPRDHADDAELVVGRQGLLDLLGVYTGLDCKEGFDRAARHRRATSEPSRHSPSTSST